MLLIAMLVWMLKMTRCPHLEAVCRKPAHQRTSSAGRKPWDAVVMFKAIP